MAAPSRFWVFWIRNTIRNVTMVVPVLMINCHVSENPKEGPVAAQTRTARVHKAKVQGLPAARAIQVLKAVKVRDRSTWSHLSLGAGMRCVYASSAETRT